MTEWKLSLPMATRIKTKNFNLTPHVEKFAEERLRKVCVNVLEYVGLEAVTEARDHHGYTDQTGNLTSSIGSVVCNGGFIGLGNMEKKKDGDKGLSKGKKLLLEIAERKKELLCLYVVAGMEYASAVENGGKTRGTTMRRPRVVLSGAELLTEKLIPQRMAESGIKCKKK